METFENHTGTGVVSANYNFSEQLEKMIKHLDIRASADGVQYFEAGKNNETKYRGSKFRFNVFMDEMIAAIGADMYEKGWIKDHKAYGLWLRNCIYYTKDGRIGIGCPNAWIVQQNKQNLQEKMQNFLGKPVTFFLDKNAATRTDKNLIES